MIRNIIFIIIATILLFLGLCSYSCQGNPRQKKVGEYSIKLNEKASFYGIDIKHVMDSQYKDLEKMFNLKAKIDDELAVLVLEKDKDFLPKQFKTSHKDYIAIFHGPMAEAQYKGYRTVKPITILINGVLDSREDVKKKEKIITELKKNIFLNEISNAAIEKIRKHFFLGNYEEDINLTLNFEDLGFPVAKFSIFFSSGYLHYQYLFSKTDQAYPY